MTSNFYIKMHILLFVSLVFHSCEKDVVYLPAQYNCSFNFNDTSLIHPKADIYQNILDENRKNGIVGAVLLVKDKHGLWIGASGKSDIASNTDVIPCNRFLIASISKVFTATAVYQYIQKGLLSMDDPINKWISHDITDKIKNANEAKIKHLLSHTSGIADFYTIKMELKRFNHENNNWKKEDMLEFIYGKKPTNAVGETYYYSNTNFLLLSMILESASGKSFKQIYQDEVFTPFQLTSAYYDEAQPIPEDCVKGYLDMYDNGKFIESRFLYQDELGIGGDGGIAINAYDLAMFLEKLWNGNILSSNSLSAMTNWFELPDGWQWKEYGQTENGYGIEKFNSPYGYAVGHTGFIDGFHSEAFYFPESEMTFVLFVNSVGNTSGSEEKIYKSTLEEMFRQ